MASTLADTPRQIIWRLCVAAVVYAILSWRPASDPPCGNPSPATSPTATLDTILVEKSFLVHLFGA